MRYSIHRFKFLGQRSYHKFYGRQLALKLVEKEMDRDFDYMTWVPVSRRRKWERGFDQSQLITFSVGKELGIRPVRLLKKVRHTQAQSSLKDAAARRANISGAFRATDPALVVGKKILLIDDILTTGATASECARVLLIAGAKEVSLAAVAAASHDKTNKNG